MKEFKLKDYKLGDTITAIATFPASSALGVIKISGLKALSIISKIFKPARAKNIRKVKTFTIHYGWIKADKKIVDEVLVSVMRKPHSYTKEDVVEISSHGGIVVLNKILELTLKQGARLALAGEFTYRALVKGRIDTLQAESILGIIEAKTDEALELASSQLKGEVSSKINGLSRRIKSLFIQTEGVINFPDQDLSLSSGFKKEVKKLAEESRSLLAASKGGRILKEGLRCVICGKSNAGKSTLFNRLLKEERVIVSQIHGTTRDIIEETINIKGIPLKIYDTAGILEPRDLIAKKAMEKTSQIFEKADLVILVLDSSRPLSKNDYFLLEKAKRKNIILVVNKSDLSQKIDFNKVSKISSIKVKMSALKNVNLKKLEDAIYNSVYKGVNLNRENIIFLNQFQRETLEKVNNNICQIEKFIQEEQAIDFINLTLKQCLDDLGKLSGQVFSEEILESIFSEFCVGK